MSFCWRQLAAINGTVRCRDMQGRTWLAFNADEKKEQVQRAFSSEAGAPGGLSHGTTR